MDKNNLKFHGLQGVVAGVGYTLMNLAFDAYTETPHAWYYYVFEGLFFGIAMFLAYHFMKFGKKK